MRVRSERSHPALTDISEYGLAFGHSHNPAATCTAAWKGGVPTEQRRQVRHFAPGANRTATVRWTLAEHQRDRERTTAARTPHTS
jgi:hypothetical protein